MNALGFPDYSITNPATGATIPINTGTPDANGSYWTLNGDLGGWAAPETRVTMVPKLGSGPSADGEIPGDLHYRGRSVTATLSCEAPSEAAREASKYLLMGALDLIDAPGTFQANEEVPVQCSIYRTTAMGQGQITVKDQGFLIKAAETQGLPGLPVGKPAYLFEATVEFYAPDPRKYAVSSVTMNIASGEGVTTNPGNTVSPNGVLTLSGFTGVGAYTIGFNSPYAMTLFVPNVPVTLNPFPTELVFDLYNKTIKDGSGNNYYYLRDLQTPWIAVPPGLQQFLSGLGSVLSGTLVYYPAYI